jgi:hypothetical protein
VASDKLFSNNVAPNSAISSLLIIFCIARQKTITGIHETQDVDKLGKFHVSFTSIGEEMVREQALPGSIISIDIVLINNGDDQIIICLGNQQLTP